METKNQSQFDLTVNFIENFVKNVFDGDDDTQKAVLFEKLKNLPKMYKPSRIPVKRKANTNPIETVDLTVEETVKIIPIKKSKLALPQNPQFPDEIWLKIIGYMKTSDVFGSFALSCKHFNNLTRDSRAIKFLHVKEIQSKEDLGKMLEVAKNSKNLIKFEIDVLYEDDLVAVDFFLNRHETNPKLKFLRIANWAELGEGYMRVRCF